MVDSKLGGVPSDSGHNNMAGKIRSSKCASTSMCTNDNMKVLIYQFSLLKLIANCAYVSQGRALKNIPHVRFVALLGTFDGKNLPPNATLESVLEVE